MEIMSRNEEKKSKQNKTNICNYNPFGNGFRWKTNDSLFQIEIGEVLFSMRRHELNTNKCQHNLQELQSNSEMS